MAREATVPLTEFGERLRAAIDRAGFKNRNQFLRTAGLENVTVRRWEIGESDPSGPLLLRAANALGVTTQFLLTGSDEAAARGSSYVVRPINPTLRELLDSPLGKKYPAEVIAPVAAIDFKNVPITHSGFLQLLDSELAKQRGKAIESPAIEVPMKPKEPGELTFAELTEQSKARREAEKQREIDERNRERAKGPGPKKKGKR